MPETTAPKPRAEYLAEYEDCAQGAVWHLNHTNDNFDADAAEHAAVIAHAAVLAQLATAAATAALAAKD